MFTEGLDNNALKWVQEGSANHRTEVPFSATNQRSRLDSFHSTRNGGRGVGLPPPSKFRSGRLSGVIPVSRVIPGDIDDSRTASENDMTTDSEEEVCGGRYSLDSSPQDDRVPSSTNTSKYRNPVPRHAPQYASDSVYSEDVNSSRETLGRGQGYVADRLRRGANRYYVGNSTYTEDESSDSAASSEFSTSQVESNNGPVQPTRANISQGYGSRVPSKLKKESKAPKNVNSRSLESQKFSDEDIPSAPPFSGADVKLDREKSPATKAEQESFTEADKSSLGSRASIIGQQNNVQKDTCESTVRTSAAAAESGIPSSTYPARLPTFHAMALGPWHAVIAYDACVRLCLNAWARGCMEAPMFLGNECALLRNSFNLQQVLLQSEEELMITRSSELPTETSATKPKKMVGKMKVQVRKVKLAHDPPTSCSFSSVKAPKVKIEAVRYHMSNMQSAISSG